MGNTIATIETQTDEYCSKMDITRVTIATQTDDPYATVATQTDDSCFITDKSWRENTFERFTDLYITKHSLKLSTTESEQFDGKAFVRLYYDFIMAHACNEHLIDMQQDTFSARQFRDGFYDLYFVFAIMTTKPMDTDVLSQLQNIDFATDYQKYVKMSTIDVITYDINELNIEFGVCVKKHGEKACSCEKTCCCDTLESLYIPLRNAFAGTYCDFSKAYSDSFSYKYWLSDPLHAAQLNPKNKSAQQFGLDAVPGHYIKNAWIITKDNSELWGFGGGWGWVTH